MTAVMPSVHWGENSANKENIVPYQVSGVARRPYEGPYAGYQFEPHPPSYQFNAACDVARPPARYHQPNPGTVGRSFEARPPFYQFNAVGDTAFPTTSYPQQQPGIVGPSFEPHNPLYQFHAHAPVYNYNAAGNPSLPPPNQAVKADPSAPMSMPAPEPERAAHAGLPVKRHRVEDSDEENYDSNKKRLSRKDLEFDWDRTQLRDPRLTPGREVPPRRETADTFHELYVCYDKGPQGSPTYDRSGFQLDYNKVAKWMRPVSSIPRGRRMAERVDRVLKKHADDMNKMMALFFPGGKGPAREEAVTPSNCSRTRCPRIWASLTTALVFQKWKSGPDEAFPNKTQELMWMRLSRKRRKKGSSLC